jgi:hypothetical protein
MQKYRIVSCLICWTCHGRMGPNHFTLKDSGAVCSLCGEKNQLGNLQKMSIQEVTEPSEILVCFTQGGTAAHALHIDCKTVLGPWIRFQSSETLERTLRYLGATDEQIAAHQNQMRRLDREAVTSGCCRTGRTCSESTGTSSEIGT